MANKTERRVNTQDQSTIDALWIDNGDGTHSQSVAGGVTVAGGPATLADGADVAQGAKADAAWNGSGAATVVSLLKAVYGVLAAQVYNRLGDILTALSPTTTPSTKAVAHNAALDATSSGPGSLDTVLVTATGAAALTIYDNDATASGTIVGYIPANAATGTIYPFNMPVALGLTVGGGATRPDVTIAYHN